ncbi:Crp/Fnr family transcriptional regulator [Magnetospirillum sulfuroxidans]|uniref:Crp/Fnr family transcriptional regulator n=1 Tax=Magnetospirillum sulfuroxidans TaxID=611300 RepID=A0ABS5IEF0_9PROT|nr:Crp/Fnr family transcriptional regulator [Magnetospirillum sulfuroxidans]MBR9972093.1 Crp/Fnr family transcriptional regulator [Magnetospirillum sulfuroxidans]
MRRTQIEAAWLGKAECRNCGIRDLVLFADLQEADFQLIHQPVEELMLDSGATLYRPGDDGAAAFTIRSGLVKLVQYLPDGNRRIVRLLRAGAVAGLEVLAGRSYEHAAEVLQPALVCRLPREVVERLNQETPRLHRQLMNKWSESLRLADEWLTELNTGTSRQRMARLFLHLASLDEDGLCRMLVREDVGAILSLTTETSSRTVAEFKRLGVVREIRPNTFQLEAEALEKIAVDG